MIFNYSKKQKIILSIVLIVLIIITIILVSFNRSQSKDLQIISQANVFAYSLEQYYDKFLAYPEVKEVDLAKIKTLTDNGLNQTGAIIYYAQTSKLARPATFSSSGGDYIIKFNVKNNWPTWDLNHWRGGECRITANAEMICQSKK